MTAVLKRMKLKPKPVTNPPLNEVAGEGLRFAVVGGLSGKIFATFAYESDAYSFVAHCQMNESHLEVREIE